MIEALFCIATAVYFEARGEPLEGQAAVAWVVHNRVNSWRYPDTACEVVTEDEHRRHQCQFSYMCDGKSEDVYDDWAYTKALAITMLTAAGFMQDPSLGATHYHATRVRPDWASTGQVVGKINEHVFYRGVK